MLKFGTWVYQSSRIYMNPNQDSEPKFETYSNLNSPSKDFRNIMVLCTFALKLLMLGY